MNTPQMIVSPGPHIHSGNSVSKIMLDFIIALIPIVVFGTYLFGLDVLRVAAIAISSAVIWEILCQKATKRPLAIKDLSAVTSGLILAMLLPPTIPWWAIVIGTLIMIIIGKEVYGGLGTNPFNGPLIAWVILKISYPDFMQDWIVPLGSPCKLAPMEILKQQGPSFAKALSYKTLLLGTVPGFIGQGSALLLLTGGCYLIFKNTINWRLPISYLAGVFFFSAIFWVVSPNLFADPIFHLLAGGTFFVAFFLATDLTSTPVTNQGMIFFGLGAGILTVIIRDWGALTFGAYYAVLIFSLATPFLDKLVPEVYGRETL